MDSLGIAISVRKQRIGHSAGTVTELTRIPSRKMNAQRLKNWASNSAHAGRKRMEEN
jgi:hypothetical protein